MLTYLTNPQELEIWLDEFMAKQMEELHVPGVTFSLVQNGELFLAKGYGYANLERQIPVVADRTLFRVGSVSKLFTATAIMQLVEKGLLSLDDDVNKYLTNFQLEDNYLKPVTIANLLTHTAGLDERLIGLFGLDPNKLEPLGELLAKKMPARVLPPGKAMSYSNCGYALLGYIVESATDISFSQYVDENILQPLLMHRSSFVQPPHLAADLSVGYQYSQKKEIYQALPFQYVFISPAGSLSATATDMAKFAIAHLQYGKYKSSRILQEDTAKQMQQTQFTHDDRIPGIGWGFMESSYSRQQAVGHGGSLPGFMSLLYLLPSHNLGFFVSDNSRGSIFKPLLEKFCARYLPIEQNNNFHISSPENQKSLKRYQGSYRHNRYARRTLDKIFLLGTPNFNLKVTADDTLCVPETLKTPNPEYLQEIEPSLLQLRVKGKEPSGSYFVTQSNSRFVAEEKDGKITFLLTNNGVWSKISWYETRTFHWALVCWFVLIFISGLVMGILALTRFSETSKHPLAQLFAILICGLNLSFIIGMLLIIGELIYETPKKLALLLCIPISTSVLAIGLPVFAILAWMNPEWLFIEQLHYSLVSLTALGFIPFLNYWNLLGFRY